MANVLLSTQRINLFPSTQDSATIDITNVSPAPVLFHVMTTSPNRYIVKHKKGMIGPNATAHLMISLLPSKLPEVANETTEFLKDTFLLEYALVDSNYIDPNFRNVSELIKKMKETGEVSKKQISCRVFLQEGKSRSPGSRMTPRVAQEHTLAGRKEQQNQVAGTTNSSIKFVVMVLIVILALLMSYWAFA